jgi:L-gulono-1,4-lactone dehydrogenase
MRRGSIQRVPLSSSDVVAVTGASGGIGHALLEQLVPKCRVRALFRARTAAATEWERRGVAPVWGDLGSEEALSNLVSGARVVFHCAAAVGFSAEQSHAVNVEGTRRLAAAAARHGCDRFVYLSSIAVYTAASSRGRPSGRPALPELTEDLPLVEHDEMAVYSRTKLQSERALIEVAAASRLGYTILRPTCVYGPRTKPFTLGPVRLITRGLPAVIGDGSGPMDVVYVDDVAGSMIGAAESPAARNEIFNIGHETVTAAEFYAHFGLMLNRPVRHLPVAAVKAVWRALQPISARPAVADLRRGLAFILHGTANPSRFPSAKARAVFGYAPRTALPAGMLRTTLWLQQQGLAKPRPFSLPGYGPLRFRPTALVHPETEADIVNVVRAAADAGQRVKAIGSLHSLSAIAETDGVCLVLDRYNKLISIDGTAATVQSGMKLRDLNDALAGANLALRVGGAIAEPTVSGAISTATHGGSIHYGSISDYVAALRIVRADGTVAEVRRGDDALAAAAVSLGALGVISTVTLRCVPAFSLQARKSLRHIDQVLANFDRLQHEHCYVDMLYSPLTGDVEMMTIDPPPSPLAPDPETGTRVARRQPGEAARRARLAGFAALTMATRQIYRWRLEGVQRFFTKRSAGTRYPVRAGRSDRVLAFGDNDIPVTAPDALPVCEAAVPYERAGEAIAALRETFTRRRRYPWLPIHIRCSPASECWLSPAYGGAVCWFQVWIFPPSDAAMGEIHEALQPFHYRFHWGKVSLVGRSEIRERFPHWDDFDRLRRQWDPDGVFLNPYLENFFGPSAIPPPSR